jgi:adenylyltransferase/sulfurtransferase
LPRFALSAAPIDVVAEAALLANPAAGGFVVFEGWVRNHNEGKPVTALAYEAFEALAVSEGMRVLEEAIRRFGLVDAACVHRSGNLAIGDRAVWVGVTARHRGEAFLACRYVIDEIKTRLPIWKRETYADGAVEWVNCQACAAHAHHHAVDEAAYYSRQRRLPELRDKGQQALHDTRILVVGAGGLGSAALPMLAGAGIGHLGICDFDRLEVSNLHRQFLYGQGDIGRPKAALAASRLSATNPFIKIQAIEQRVAPGNVASLIADYDLVLDCTDNFATKFLLNDACVSADKPLVSASVHRFEGQILASEADNQAGCLRCLWPEPPCIACDNKSCEDTGILGAVPATVGAMQAMEAIKIVLGLQSDASSHLLVWDGLSSSITRLKRRRDTACIACGAGPATIAKAAVLETTLA